MKVRKWAEKNNKRKDKQGLKNDAHYQKTPDERKCINNGGSWEGM